MVLNPRLVDTTHRCSANSCFVMWGTCKTTRCGMFSTMPNRKRQADVMFSPVMRSPAMKKADQVIRAIANKDVTLTLIGESGTGKEVLARRIHDLSERRNGPFVPINCAAIPETLFESELFGHERGAFTGANARAVGKIEAATRGTLFLDEIGELPLSLQAKLLRFLENRRYMRIGGTTKIEADVRLVFATLRPLEQDVQAGRFRADLFYRIQGITLIVPPLRERRADIQPLLNQFVLRLSGTHSVRPPKFTREVKQLFLQHRWPGNVRELRNVVETLCLLRSGRTVRVRDLPQDMQDIRSQARLCPAAGDAPSGIVTLNLDDGLASLIQRVVETALDLSNGDKGVAARRLHISPRTIQRYVSSGRVRSRIALPSLVGPSQQAQPI